MLLDGHGAEAVAETLGLSSVSLLYGWKARLLRQNGATAAEMGQECAHDTERSLRPIVGCVMSQLVGLDAFGSDRCSLMRWGAGVLLFVVLSLGVVAVVVRTRAIRAEQEAIDYCVNRGAVLFAAEDDSRVHKMVIGESGHVLWLCLGTSEVCEGTHEWFAYTVRWNSERLGGRVLHDAVDEDLVRIARMPLLESVALEGREITDAGVARLSECRRLRLVRLGSPLLSDTSLGYLRQLPLLSRLELVGTPVSDEAVKQLRQERPGVHVEVLARDWAEAPFDERAHAEAIRCAENECFQREIELLLVPPVPGRRDVTACPDPPTCDNQEEGDAPPQDEWDARGSQ